MSSHVNDTVFSHQAGFVIGLFLTNQVTGKAGGTNQ
jgi:hypothetical protein